MTRRPVATADGVLAHPHRYRLSRAGILNVWQYDEQVFDFADGRLLLRGANGAGKSKTLEVLLPFVLDGDKLRMTASGRHHTSLLWLMTDGYDGTGRVGYVWVEFARTTGDGARQWLTCGIGIRASQSTRTATSWYFTSPRRVGFDLSLEDETGPLGRERCRAAVEDDGRFFDSPRQYKQHVGETLFGLSGDRYDDLLKLLYWLRQPQVGEDIEPGRLADILSVALPELDDTAVRTAGGTLDELAAFGEQLGKRRQAAEAMTAFAQLYADYARGMGAARGGELVEAHRELARLDREIGKRTAALADLAGGIVVNRADRQAATGAVEDARQRLADLEASPEARSQQQLLALGRRADELRADARRTRDHADDARDRARTYRQRLDEDEQRICRESRGLAAAGQQRAADFPAVGVRAALVVPASLAEPELPDRDGRLRAALDEHEQAVEAVRPLVGERQAAVRVVEEAGERAEQLDATRRDAEREAARLEGIADAERRRLADAEQAAGAEEDAFAAALAAWQDDPRGIPVEVPDELTADTVTQLRPRAIIATRPRLDALAAAAADAASSRLDAERHLATLRERRAAIEAERDPAPAPPALGRSERSDVEGAPLWRLVEYAGGLDAEQQAGLEAALESSGLLDAWVRVDGQVLDAGQRDVLLPAGPPQRGRTLGSVLVADRPAGCPVSTATIEGVLARISVEPSDDAVAAVGPDGSWRLGPLTGQAAKPAAQYIGATARAAERARRLAEIDTEVAAWEQSHQVATAAEAAAREQRVSVEAWLDDTPRYDALLGAWAEVRVRTDATARADEAAGSAEQIAVQARAATAAARQERDRLAATHELPTTLQGLAAYDERLRALDSALATQVTSSGRLTERLDRYRDDDATWAGLDEQAGRLHSEAGDLRQQATAAARRHAELREAAAASIRELEDKLATTRAEQAEARGRAKELDEQHVELIKQEASATQALADLGEQRAGHEPVVVAAAHAVAALLDVPGLITSAGAPDEPGGYELARGVVAGAAVPAAVVELARSLASLDLPERTVTDAAVWSRYTEVTSGPAADCEPRVLEYPGLLCVIARDESGEYSLGELADRLTAGVARDAELLTDRERRVFEEHILGDLGEALRARRLEAEELVAAMNRLLDGVTTSQGVRVSLSWRLRDDVPEDAKAAVKLLGRPLGALLPDERQALRDALHRLIEASRSEEPELSYTEHLSRALDYREWFGFRVRYTRPEFDGGWLDLHRRSPLSQGEQKVVCYLPLFAAAAAHFSSVAGAAPHAPRFVLLDDAFPKIDVRTHPLLFGLLVDLDLDFLITSERLWGDHDTVPALAIYEALRDPSERGIAQYQHRWDGQRLHAVGAS
jgi:uncharacterized protein (TIGR02680 family)